MRRTGWTRTRPALLLSGFTISALLTGAALVAAPPPLAVSPGDERGSVISDHCPTFHWGTREEVESFELGVYELGSDGAEPERILERVLPGVASGWTPALAECLVPGRRYAWTVRSSDGSELSEWAPLRVFRISPVPQPRSEANQDTVARPRERRSGLDVVATAGGRPHDRAGAPGPRKGVSAPSSEAPSRRVGQPVITVPTSYSLTVGGDLRLGGNLFKGGVPFLHEAGAGLENVALGRQAMVSTTTGSFNIGVGAQTLNNNTEGNYNVAVGDGALKKNVGGDNNTGLGDEALGENTGGSNNTAVGWDAMASNQLGSSNTAVGHKALRAATDGLNSAFGAEALEKNTTGFQNTAIGHAALRDSTTGKQNTAVGQAALLQNQTGNYNTAVGEDALRFATGSRNIALGRYAGRANTSGSDNIFIGNQGGASDSNTIRLGVLNFHDKTYIAGINNSTVSDADVMIDTSTGRLGIPTSSRRFKEDIRDMAGASRDLMDLRPVTFRRKGAGGDVPSRTEFGLVAEEVAESFPELVIYDADEEPYGVRYHLLPAMLLNELQQQRRRDRVQGWLLVFLGVSFTASLVLRRR